MEGWESAGYRGSGTAQRGPPFSWILFVTVDRSLKGSPVLYKLSSVKDQSFRQILLFLNNVLLKKWSVSMWKQILLLSLKGKTKSEMLLHIEHPAFQSMF